MLSIKENFLETIRGGSPDRFVKQFEYMELVFEVPSAGLGKRGESSVSEWGVSYVWPEDQISRYPVHTPDKIVVKDIKKWRDQLKVPTVIYPPERWEAAARRSKEIKAAGEKYVSLMVYPGAFTITHTLMGMEGALMAYFDEPEALYEMTEVLFARMMAQAEQFVKYVEPELIFHHDDWGSAQSTFLAPPLFKEFYVEGYKKLYKYYKDNGVEFIVHHSDSYAETLVPSMIEMGIDVWQGCVTNNNVPQLIKDFGSQISYMGYIDNSIVDRKDWTRELVEHNVRKAVEECGKHYYIPCLTEGQGKSVFPGVYETVNEFLDELSKEFF